MRSLWLLGIHKVCLLFVQINKHILVKGTGLGNRRTSEKGMVP